MPLKWGDVWNPRLECWWSEIHSGLRHPEGHEEADELTDKGKEVHGLKVESFSPVKRIQEKKEQMKETPTMPTLPTLRRRSTEEE